MSGIRLGHVHLSTADLDRFARFYEHTIGLRLVAVDHAPQNGSERLGVFADGRGVAIIASEHTDFDLDDGERHNGVAIDHAAFDADGDEFDTAVERLVQAGASDGEMTTDGPTRTVTFFDPDGRACRLCRPDPDWTPPSTVEVIACSTRSPRETS